MERLLNDYGVLGVLQEFVNDRILSLRTRNNDLRVVYPHIKTHLINIRAIEQKKIIEYKQLFLSVLTLLVKNHKAKPIKLRKRTSAEIRLLNATGRPPPMFIARRHTAKCFLIADWCVYQMQIASRIERE